MATGSGASRAGGQVEDGRGGFMPVPPIVSQEVLHVLKHSFNAREDDTFIVSYPKAGTTWMSQIVHLLTNDGKQGEKLLIEAIPYLEGLGLRDTGQAIENIGNFENISGRRFFVSHLPYPLMPGAKNFVARYVYVARNPKDVAVSRYYFEIEKRGYHKGWDAFFELYIAGKVSYGSALEHMIQWWEASQRSDRVVFFKYEDIHRNPAGVVDTLADFLELSIDSHLREAVLDKSRFDTMGRNPKTDKHWSVKPPKGSIFNSSFYRKGIVGDWKNHFSDEQNALFDRLIREKLVGTGLQFDFEPII